MKAQQLIREYEQNQTRFDIPDFQVGDRVKVHVKVREGDKERIQPYEGTVIRVQGRDVRTTFTVRKVSYGVGVERTFPLNSPMVAQLDIMQRGIVRRARLYYLRALRGKASRIREKREF